jgi:copper transport protein
MQGARTVPGVAGGQENAMGSLSRAIRRGLVCAALAAVFGLLFASPAAAHAELVATNPANGAQLADPPDEVVMTFTESVNLLQDGIRLVDSVGATVPTSEPVADGHTVTWPMPEDLPDGSYTVTWKLVSSDGHPVAGAFSFGVGAAAANILGITPGVTTADSGSPAAPWPVVTARLAGYLAFALLAGVVAFVLWCSAGRRTEPHLQRLLRVGIVGGLLATVAGLLLQGPYTAGVPLSQLLDPLLVRDTVATPFGTAMVRRLALYAAIGVLVWRLPALVHRPIRWLVPAGVVGIALTIAATGHGNGSGRLVDLVLVALHTLTAGIWVGGLVVLAVLGRTVERREWLRFGTLAMACVLALVATGSLNSFRKLTAVEQLWETTYGLVLGAKLVLVAATLVAAAVSRRRLQQERAPRESVRIEGGLLVGVLVATALLSMTSPPPQGLAPGRLLAASAAGTAPGGNDVVEMSLGDRGKAALAVLPATTAGSELHVILTDERGQPLPARRVALKVSNPDRGVGGIPVPLTRRNGVWVADYRFPLTGAWTATMTVEERGRPAVVTAGDVTISD